MKNNKLQYKECLDIYKIDDNFIRSLYDAELVNIVEDSEECYVEIDDLEELEQYIRWYYDLDINMEGIEALHHMLKRVESLQDEITRLKNELNFYINL